MVALEDIAFIGSAANRHGQIEIVVEGRTRRAARGIVEARVTRNGLVGSVIVPENVRLPALGEHVGRQFVLQNARHTVKAVPKSSSPMPWLFDHNVSLPPKPVRYRAEFIRYALVMAGLGGESN